ncbi:MAG: hypothetical protein ACLP22_23775, partial [Solirubrobacteraceae bacterium]
MAAIHDALSGLAVTLEQFRAKGVPGYELELIGADAATDRPLGEISERRYDLIHLCGPGPTAVAALALAGLHGVPIRACYETSAGRPAR